MANAQKKLHQLAVSEAIRANRCNKVLDDLNITFLDTSGRISDVFICTFRTSFHPTYDQLSKANAQKKLQQLSVSEAIWAYRCKKFLDVLNIRKWGAFTQTDKIYFSTIKSGLVQFFNCYRKWNFKSLPWLPINCFNWSVLKTNHGGIISPASITTWW